MADERFVLYITFGQTAGKFDTITRDYSGRGYEMKDLTPEEWARAMVEQTSRAKSGWKEKPDSVFPNVRFRLCREQDLVEQLVM